MPEQLESYRISMSKSDYVLSSCVCYDQNVLNRSTFMSKSINQNVASKGRTNVNKSPKSQSILQYDAMPYPGQIMQTDLSLNQNKLSLREGNKQNVPLYLNFVKPSADFTKKHKVPIIVKVQQNSQVSHLSDQSRKFIQNSVLRTLSNKSQVYPSNAQRDSQVSRIIMSQPQYKIQIWSGKDTKNQNYYDSSNSNNHSINHSSSVSSQNQLSSVLSFQHNNQDVQLFYTEQDQYNQNNISEEGIQLLSELKGQLNTIVNQSGCGNFNQQAQINQSCQSQRLIHPFIEDSNARSQGNQEQISEKCSFQSKGYLDPCELVSFKLEELKANIKFLHQRINYSILNSSISSKSGKLDNSQNLDKNQNIIQSYTPKTAKGMKNQLQVNLQSNYSSQYQKSHVQPKQLIYHDSKVIFYPEDQQNIQYGQQFSKIMDQQNYQKMSQQKISQYKMSQQKMSQQKMSQQKMSQQKMSQQKDEQRICSVQRGSNYDERSREQICKDIQLVIRSSSSDKSQEQSQNSFEQSNNSHLSFEKSDEMLFQRMNSASKTSFIKIQFDKEAFKLLDFQQFEVQKFISGQKTINNSLSQSNNSSSSHETFALQEINKKFNKKFDQLFQLN